MATNNETVFGVQINTVNNQSITNKFILKTDKVRSLWRMKMTYVDLQLQIVYVKWRMKCAFADYQIRDMLCQLLLAGI